MVAGIPAARLSSSEPATVGDPMGLTGDAQVPPTPSEPLGPTARLRIVQLASITRSEIGLTGATISRHTSCTFPPASPTDKSGKPAIDWRVLILPYLLDQAGLFKERCRLDEPWDSEHNRHLIARMPGDIRVRWRTPRPPDRGRRGTSPLAAPNTMFRGEPRPNQSQRMSRMGPRIRSWSSRPATIRASSGPSPTTGNSRPISPQVPASVS